jgi:hypothetical protein
VSTRSSVAIPGIVRAGEFLIDGPRRHALLRYRG